MSVRTLRYAAEPAKGAAKRAAQHVGFVDGRHKQCFPRYERKAKYSHRKCAAQQADRRLLLWKGNHRLAVQKRIHAELLGGRPQLLEA